MFFKHEPQRIIDNEIQEHCFFIPIVEQVRAGDYNKEYIWNLAKEANITRKFYSSPELLAQMESGRLGTDKVLSCYKVSLTETQRQQLKTVSGKNYVLLGSLNFNYSDIENLICFVQGQQQQYANPFYEQDTPVNQTACAA